MIVYNHRMLEGKPLQYYTPSLPIPIPTSNSFSYFNRFQCFGSPSMSDDLVMPHSPNGSQSDSDNSVSSVEIFPKEIRGKQANSPSSKKAEDVQCRWISCGIVFESLDQLATHVSRVHAASGPDGLFYCGWEGCSRNSKGFNARYKMLVHVRTHTNEKPHQCCQCEKSFSRAENLKIHSRSHSGEKPYVCPVPGCQKAYSNSSDRFKHTRTHQVDKPYQCKVPGCPKRYTDPSSLRKHVKTYKHFVNEKGLPDANASPKIVPTIVVANNVKTETLELKGRCRADEPCTCAHPCYKTTDLLNLGAFINLKNREIKSWNKILDPFIPQPKIFKPYELEEEKMDIDLPLDLSINRRHV
ncbi:hypothetical protein ILUMI_21145 [Ignelater luminosus]|uniref:C2H2-type domain-containing protein n=1 Tax=Ignelater luminosus TaxID=2038154 RepID=A0A8K0G3Z0_IGNLU|nr:hypothetical protein ILUMI_21145 [Ignelater luminosus]